MPEPPEEGSQPAPANPGETVADWDESVDTAKQEAPPVSRRSFLRSPRTWLVIFVLVYFAVSLYLSMVRVWELYATNWDLGIFQQALWTGSHGGFFYESGDFENTAASSFLQIHPSLLMFVLAPIYRVLPSVVTLLGIQSFVIALAAVPLFFITTRVTGSQWKALLAAGMYLVWAPTLSSNLYDFHLEAFLPVELLACFLFWLRRQYIPGAVCAALACVTFEVGPVFVFLIGLFFFLPPLRASARTFLQSVFGGRPGDHVEVFTRTVRRSVAGWIRSSQVIASILLMVGAGVSYYLLRYWEGTILNAPGSSPPGAPVGWLGSVFQRLDVAPANLSFQFLPKIEFWFLVFGLLAFIPLLAPRTFLLTGPWIVFVMFSTHSGFWNLGFQTGIVLAFPVMVGLAYGLKGISFGSPVQAISHWWATIKKPPDDVARPPPGAPTRAPVARRIPWVWVVLALIVVNVALSPMDPYVRGGTVGPAYNIVLPETPGYANARAVANMVPAGAQVLASTDLFPLVANDRKAYPLDWVATPLPYFPFTAANLPSYVLVSERYLVTTPGWLATALYNPTQYGLVGWAGNSPAGLILLFEKGYNGSARAVSPVQYLSSVYSGTALSIGPVGRAGYEKGVGCPYTVVSLAGDTGSVWYGPYATLSPDNYTVLVTLSSWAANATAPKPTATALEVILSAFGVGTISDKHYSFSQISGPNCVTLTYNVAFPEPVTNFQVRGYQDTTDTYIGLQSVIVIPD